MHPIHIVNIGYLFPDEIHKKSGNKIKHMVI